ncbi:hypothetical protein BDK92_0399 [Micromonospora pisi]|uniref:SMODS and SLOG-associating 2TM effector domain-containing protein n=1 Tax=Micromonospora pisi TaxID=589240 RepID=A0A495JB76_9ACTN|nr:hypothetical protein [Micromonospora pisi]RKR86177.1 hypothetical protein BDK92_0399 [Micromonospora pisi]
MTLNRDEMAAEASRIRKDLQSEAMRIAEAADVEARSTAAAARRWNIAYLALGLPTAIVAAVAGAAGLASADGRVPAAVLAFVVAGASGAATFLGAESRALEARRRASGWRALEADSRLVALFEGRKSVTTELRNQISLLIARQHAILSNDLDRDNEIRLASVGKYYDALANSSYEAAEEDLVRDFPRFAGESASPFRGVLQQRDLP